MSRIIEPAIATTQPSKGAPKVAEDRAISFLVPFAEVKHLLVDYPPPKRPNRNRPINLGDTELRREFQAWEAASDEALRVMEEGLPE